MKKNLLISAFLLLLALSAGAQTDTCPAPGALQASAITNASATLTWVGSEGLTYEIVCDTAALSPAQLDTISSRLYAYSPSASLAGLAPGATYHAYVRTDCGDALSPWAETSFRTRLCEGGCDLSIVMHDYFGDGWTGNAISLWQNNSLLGSATLDTGSYGTATFDICPNDTVLFLWTSGSFPEEASFEILDAFDYEVYTCSYGSFLADGGTFLRWASTCLPPACLRPATATVTALTSTTATLAWTDADTASPAGHYRVLYGTANNPAQATDSADFLATTGQLAGLAPNTRYFAWVRALCGAEPSALRPFGSFVTDCAVVTAAELPYTLDFDSLAGNGNMAQAPCWTHLFGDGQNPCPNRNVDHSHSGNNSLSFWSDPSRCLPNAVALPAFDNLSSLQLSFWADLWEAGQCGAFVVGVLEEDSIVPVDTLALTPGYSQYTVPFNSYLGTGLRPVLYAHRADGMLRVNVDDIVVDLIPNCPRPSNIALTAATATTLSLAWDGDGNQGWDLFWSSSPTAQPQPLLSTADSFATITGLQPNTIYYVYVRTNCGLAGHSQWSIATEMQTFLCDNPCQIYVTIHEAVNPAANWNSIILIQNGQELARLRGPFDTDGPYPVQVCPYDSIVVRRVCHISVHRANIGYTITSATGQTLLDYPIGTICSTGEANITTIGTIATDCALPTCMEPDSLRATAVSGSSAAIAWQDTLASAWRIVYAPENFEPATPPASALTLQTSTPAITLTALRSLTRYHLYVQALCDDDSLWSDELNFLTLACNAPDSLRADSLTHQSATLAWLGTAAAYEAQLLLADSLLLTTTTAANHLTLTALEPETTYLLRLRSLCDSASASPWAQASFTTCPQPCFAPTALTALAVTNSTATLAWTPTGDEAAWQLAYTASGITLDTILTTPQATLASLFADAAYTARVRALCGDPAVESPWSEPLEFATRACPVPTALSAATVAATEATLTWQAPEGYADFLLLYGTSEDASAMTPLPASGSAHTLTSLQPDTRYYAALRTLCAEGWSSDLTPFLTFRTATASIAAPTAEPLTLYPNPTADYVVVGVNSEQRIVNNRLEIIDLQGRTRLSIQPSSPRTTLDLTPLPAGTYFVKLGPAVKKLIVK